MSEKDTATLSRPTKIFFQKPEKVVPACSPAMALDMGEASREEGFRLNGCR